MTDTIPTHTMTTTTMTAVATLSVAACIPATAGEFVPSKSADEHMLTGKTRRLNPAGLSCEECQRQSSLLTFILRESDPALAPASSDLVYARPDDYDDDGITWREHVRRYN